jgi:hypothetical protein
VVRLGCGASLYVGNAAALADLFFFFFLLFFFFSFFFFSFFFYLCVLIPRQILQLPLICGQCSMLRLMRAQTRRMTRCNGKADKEHLEH